MDTNDPEYKDLPADVEEKISTAKEKKKKSENRKLVQRQLNRQQPVRQQTEQQQLERQQTVQQQTVQLQHERQQPEQEQQQHTQQYDPESIFKVSKQYGGKSVAITGYAGTQQTVNIPPKIQGLPVTGIMGRAFIRCTGLTSVTIPDIRKTARFT